MSDDQVTPEYFDIDDTPCLVLLNYRDISGEPRQEVFGQYDSYEEAYSWLMDTFVHYNDNQPTFVTSPLDDLPTDIDGVTPRILRLNSIDGGFVVSRRRWEIQVALDEASEPDDEPMADPSATSPMPPVSSFAGGFPPGFAE